MWIKSIGMASLLTAGLLTGDVYGQEQPPLDPIPESVRETPVVRAVRRVEKSVVSILTESPTRGRSIWGWTIKDNPGRGSGVIIDRAGLVITNYHVVHPLLSNPGGKLWVKPRDYTKKDKGYASEIVTYDVDNDLAVLRIIDPKGVSFTPITRGTSKDLMAGETVIALGNPFGQEHTVTVGVLSAQKRDIRVQIDNKTLVFKDLLQTDAAINPGNSGGALVNLTGKLIGINNAIRRDSEGIGYAIPIDRVNKVLDKLMDLDQGATYWLGMTVNAKGKDLIISNLYPDGPAWKSGLRNGDKILSIGKRKVNSKKEFHIAFLANVHNFTASFLVRRGKDKLRVSVLCGKPSDKATLTHLGILAKTVPLSQSAINLLQYTAGVQTIYGSAVKIEKVIKKGPAESVGLQKGDLLLAFAVNHRVYGKREFQVHSVNKLADTLAGRERGTDYPFLILRKGALYRGAMKIR